MDISISEPTTSHSTFYNAGLRNETWGGFKCSIEHHKTGPSDCNKTQTPRSSYMHGTTKCLPLMFYFSKIEEYGAFLKTLTCPRLPRHAVGLGLVISLLILVTDQVRVGLRAESCSNADDMFIGCIYHLLHLKNTEKYTFLYNTAVCQLLLYLLIIFTYIHCLILA